MKSTKANLPKTTAMATWVKGVKGHQDDKVQYKDLPFEERENINMDMKCESMRTSGEPTPPIPYFSSEKVLIVIEGIPVTQQLQEYLHFTTAGPALCKYICKKASWTRDTFDMVNWPALELNLQNLPGDKHTNVVKMQHGWIFTAEPDHLFQSKTTAEYKTRTASSFSPSNAMRSNTKRHFLTWEKSPLHSKVTKELKPLIVQTLRNLNTDPNI